MFKSLSILAVALLIAVVGTGCGTLHTEYKPSPGASREQKRKIVRTVDATVARLSFKVDAAPVGGSEPAFHRRYYSHSTLIWGSGLPDSPVYSVWEGGRFKSRKFRAAEDALTSELRRIDPRIRITSWYAVNPWM